jgi:hypothetical protein
MTIGGKGGSVILIAWPRDVATSSGSSALGFERTSRGVVLREIHISGRPLTAIGRTTGQ